ncbi:MAG: phenylalanine--tRNA ligase subunit beta [Chloroflexi bacterium]|jgi:phenylalanyl-tRNA synthetase beta chain|nr:phenylalanine--tRNA ligase subunit beta [Chloroflexota bacterium]
MLVPISWLREYVNLDMPLEVLVERLTFGGLEVVGVERIGETWDRDTVVVGEVVSVRQHPNADRLVLVTINYGKEQPLEVVTGAPNLKVGDSGQKVVFAMVGARLIDPYADTLRYQTLKKSKIRGVTSEGMVCSEKELGISEEHTGIMILPDDAPVGMPFADYWGDTVLELDLTPNLAHASSIVGVAREVAAMTGATLHIPALAVQAEGEPIEGKIEIEIQDPDLCPRYSAALIRGVKIGPSPMWMQRRLTLAGMRPINNIVDITNYVMLEWGQPLHAFDYHRLQSRTPGGPPTIIVRRAHQGERMTTLDGVQREFTDDMLLITDGGGPVAVAGVMGGEDSEITEDTVDILLESANFYNISVRRTAARLKIPSEAAQHFGKGVDPELTVVALRRAAELMRALADGTVAQGFADAYPNKPATKVVDLPTTEVTRILGITLSAEEIARMLKSLDFATEIIPGESPVVRATVPSFRLDVSLPADLLEEVARLYGYDRLPVSLLAEELTVQMPNRDLEVEEKVRDVLVGCGLTEIITYSMTSLASVARLNVDQTPPDPKSYIEIANPLNREQRFLRQTLMNTTLETMASNLRFVERVAVLEIGSVYLREEGEALPAEPRRLSIGLCGPREARSWLSSEGENFGFYDLKGIIETLCARLGIQDVHVEATQHPTLHPGRAARLSIGGVDAGVFGEVHPLVRANFDLPDETVCLAELDLEVLLSAARLTESFAAISRMPALKLDLAVVVDEQTPSDQVAALIRETGGATLVDVVLFDVYRGAQIGEGKKSLAYSLTFQAMDRTLTTEEATKQRERIVARLSRELGATVRG